MLKSCSRCGRIHARGDPCPVKCAKVVEKRNKEIVRFRNRQVWKRMREHIKERDKLKSCAETVVRINQRINAVCVPSVHYIVRILQRISVPLKQNLHMYVMVAASFPNVPC